LGIQTNESFLETVTADSDHPAAAASFIKGHTNSSLCQGRQSGSRQALGLGLPSALARPPKLPPMMSTAEECDDLAALATSSGSTRKPLSRFIRRLSAILEVAETPSPGLPVGQLSEPAQQAPPVDSQIAQENKKNSPWQRFRRWFIRFPKGRDRPRHD